MKCANCNKRLKKNNHICPNCAFDMTFYLQEAAATKTLSTGKKCLLVLLTLVILCGSIMAALLFSGMFTPAKMIVATAFATTSLQLEQEREALGEELAILSYLAQVADGQSTLAISSTLPQFSGVVYLTMDTNASQYVLKGSTSSETLIAATGYLSPQSAILHLEDSDSAIGLNLETLVDDLIVSSFATLFDVDAIADGYRTDMLENITKMDEELSRLLDRAILTMTVDWNAEKLGEETLEIDGETIETTEYALLFDTAALTNAAQTFVDGFCTSDVFSPYLAVVAHEHGMTPAELHAALTQGMDYLLNDLIGLEDCTITVNLYEGRVVLLTADGGEGGYALALNPTGAILSYLSVAMRDEYGIAPYVTTSITMNSGVYTASCDLLGVEHSLRYFSQDSSDNLIFTRGDITSLVATVDTSCQDALTVIFPLQDGYITVDSALTTLDTGWFTPPDYTNLLTMSQTDLMLLVMALSF